ESITTEASAAPPVFDPLTESNKPPADESSTTEGLEPPAQWQQAKTAKTQRIAAIVATGLIGVVAIAIVITVWMRRDNGPPVAANVPEQPESAAGSDPPDSDVPEPESEETKDEVEEVSTNESVDEEPVEPALDPAMEEAEVAPPAEIPSDLLPQNPLLPDNPLVPGNPLAPGNPMETGTPGGEEVTEAAGMTEFPAEFRGLFNDLGNLDRAQFPNAAPPPTTIDEFQVDQAADVVFDRERMIDAAKPVNMREALGLQIAMQTANQDGYPLNDLLLRLSQLSGVPIDVQWVAMDLTGIGLTDRVPTPSGWVTLEEILVGICQASGCEYEAKSNSIEFRPAKAIFDARVAECLDLSDLTNSESAFVTARTLLGQDATTTDRVDLPDTFELQQIAVLVCESIRQANGGQGKVRQEALRRWAGPIGQQASSWPTLDASNVANGSTGTQLVQSASIASLWIRLARANNATCFVNWADASKSGLDPTAQRMPRTGPRVPVAEAMTQLLERTYLQVRQVDERHWWVGSESTFDRFPVVVRLDEPGMTADPEKTRQLIESLIAGSGSEGRVAVDSGSRMCIAVLPRFLVRQIPRLLE
ncbi:MAG: hypothetical protein AAGJ83_07325, partial [Planctomycetota bacterium]